MLGIVVTDMAYRTYPDMPEGSLAKLRAAIVNMTALADVSRSLGLGDHLLLGKGEEQSGGRDKASILADALEAVLGAVYLDRGLDVARELIERLFRPRMEAYARGEGDRDYKTILQELASQALRSLPGVPAARRGSRSREGVHGHRVPRRRDRTARVTGPVQEGSRAAGRPGGVRAPVLGGAGRRRGDTWSFLRSR